MGRETDIDEISRQRERREDVAQIKVIKVNNTLKRDKLSAEESITESSEPQMCLINSLNAFRNFPRLFTRLDKESHVPAVARRPFVFRNQASVIGGQVVEGRATSVRLSVGVVHISQSNVTETSSSVERLNNFTEQSSS